MAKAMPEFVKPFTQLFVLSTDTQDKSPILAQPLTSYVTSGKLYNLSVPQLPHL
jgi:hypothetical protein